MGLNLVPIEEGGGGIARYGVELAAALARRNDIELHLLPTGQTPHMRYNDFTRTSELISLAYEASSAYLAGRELPTEVLV